MKNKLAMWSCALPIINVIFYISFWSISLNMRFRAGVGSPITNQEHLLALIFAFIFLLITFIGFYLAQVGFRRIKKDPSITGKWHAIIGIILNIVLFCFGLLLLGGALIGG